MVLDIERFRERTFHLQRSLGGHRQRRKGKRTQVGTVQLAARLKV